MTQHELRQGSETNLKDLESRQSDRRKQEETGGNRRKQKTAAT
jgi:hypothetical protein